MSEKIIKELDRFFVLRLRWWAQFREHGGTAVPSSFPVEGPAGNGTRSSFHTTRVPLMMGLVHDTEMALSSIPLRYSQTVKQFWFFEGRSMRWHGRHRGIDYHTFETWLLKGHDLLHAEFAATRARWEKQVSEAEALMTPEMRCIRMQNEEREVHDVA